MTYRRLKELVKCVASGFVRLGVRKGEVVFILAPNSVEWVLCYLGALSAGATVTAANPTFTAGIL